MPTTLFGDQSISLPNVAAVPQYSPFRYPGGKSRWYKIVKHWVLSTQPSTFVEPFAGGAHAGLAVAVEALADEVVLVELDENVAAVWETIINGDVEWLIKQMDELELTHQAAEEVIERADESLRDKALAMIIHNRVSRGGVTAPGAGWIKKGENGQGITSRWYPDTLIKRIRTIAEASDRITFIHGDGMEVAEEYVDDARAAFFIDPPYPKAGGRLYEHSNVDHEAIFELAATVEGTVLLTYDDSDEVVQLAERFEMDYEPLIVSTTHHLDKKELLIGQDLSWLHSMSV
jgi:DNA adenine methylase